MLKIRDACGRIKIRKHLVFREFSMMDWIGPQLFGAVSHFPKASGCSKTIRMVTKNDFALSDLSVSTRTARINRRLD